MEFSPCGDLLYSENILECNNIVLTGNVNWTAVLTLRNGRMIDWCTPTGTGDFMNVAIYSHFVKWISDQESEPNQVCIISNDISTPFMMASAHFTDTLGSTSEIFIWCTPQMCGSCSMILMILASCVILGMWIGTLVKPCVFCLFETVSDLNGANGEATGDDDMRHTRQRNIASNDYEEDFVLIPYPEEPRPRILSNPQHRSRLQVEDVTIAPQVVQEVNVVLPRGAPTPLAHCRYGSKPKRTD